MKHNFFSSLCYIAAICIFSTGYIFAAAPKTPGNVDTAAPVQESNPTATPVPANVVTPAATPEPIPCTLAFDSNRDGNQEIYRMAPDGSDTVNLTVNKGDDTDPAWSPDGSQIAFVSNRDNEKEGGQFIYVMNADGSNVHQLTTENESKWPDWSHNGSQITYTNKGDIYVINVDGSGQSINLTNSPEQDVQSTWSPDGRKIAWLSGNNGKQNVFVMDSDGSHVQQITDNGRVSAVNWTGDGRILTGWGWKDQQEFCNNCVINADGSNIIDAGGKGEVERYEPFWTLAGDMVGVANLDMFAGNNEIYLVSKTFPDPQGLGAGFVNLTNNPADDRNPDWPANCGPGTEVKIVDLEKPKVPGQIVIGYAGDVQEKWQQKNDFQKACDEIGIKCVSGEFSKLVEQGVNAIVQNANPAVVDDLTPSIKKAREKGIPVFVLGAELNAEGSYSISVDQHQWVNTSLQWMFKKIGGKGDFAYFDFQPDKVHAAVIEDTLKKFPEIKVVTQQGEKYNFSENKSSVGTLMDDYPNLKAIWANDSLSTIVLGMADTGIPSEKWPLLMCEPTKAGLFIWKDRLKDHPGMQCIAVSDPPGIAYDAVYAAYYLASGGKINESALGGPYKNSLYVDSPVVTYENLYKWIEKINFEKDDYIVDELMKPDVIKEKWFIK